eukprot:s2712_g11.t1
MLATKACETASRGVVHVPFARGNMGIGPIGHIAHTPSATSTQATTTSEASRRSHCRTRRAPGSHLGWPSSSAPPRQSGTAAAASAQAVTASNVPADAAADWSALNQDGAYTWPIVLVSCIYVTICRHVLLVS